MAKMIDGKEYVTLKEFAERMQVSYKTVLRYSEKGVLKPEKEKLLNLEESESAFRKEQLRNIKSISKKYRPVQEIPTIEDIDIPILEGIVEEELAPDEEALLKRVKWYEYTDCISFSNGKPIMNPVSKKPLMDFERLKARLTAERYLLDIQERLEPYLKAEENLGACTMVEESLLSRDFSKEYTSVISKWVEKTYGKKLNQTSEQKIYETIRKEEKNFRQNCQDTLKQQRELSCYEV